MVLKDLIAFLETQPKDKVVPLGFNYPHSYRGFYSELAFEPKENATIGEMLDCAKEALDSTYEGYKGGDYTMDEYTNCYLAEYGCTGEGIGIYFLKYMVGEL